MVNEVDKALSKTKVNKSAVCDGVCTISWKNIFWSKYNHILTRSSQYKKARNSKGCKEQMIDLTTQLESGYRIISKPIWLSLTFLSHMIKFEDIVYCLSLARLLNVVG